MSATFIGKVLGTGTGRGTGLIMVASCLFMWVGSLAAYAYPRIRLLESEIPDAVLEDNERVSQDPEMENLSTENLPTREDQ